MFFVMGAIKDFSGFDGAKLYGLIIVSNPIVPSTTGLKVHARFDGLCTVLFRTGKAAKQLGKVALVYCYCAEQKLSYEISVDKTRVVDDKGGWQRTEKSAFYLFTSPEDREQFLEEQNALLMSQIESVRGASLV